MNKRIPIFLGFILLALAIWMQTTSIDVIKQLIVRLDNVTYDMQLRARIFTHTVKPTSPVAIVDIDDKSLAAEGRWPWSRDKLATLVKRLQEENVVVVAMDIMFSEKESDIADIVIQELNKRNLATPAINDVLKKVQPELNNDIQFAKSLDQQNMDVELGMTFIPRAETSGLLPTPALTLTTLEEKQLGFIDQIGYISNIAVLQSAAKNAGFINVYPDADGIIRRVPLLIRYQDKLYPSLALGAVKLFLLQNVSLVTGDYNNVAQLEAVKVGDHTIPTNALSQMLIPFRGKSFSFPYFSATDVINKHLPPNALAGKIIFLGTSATGLGDLRATAIQGVFPGVEIQASIADGILENNFSYKPEWTIGAEVALTAIVGIILAFLFPFLGPRTLTILAITIPLCLIFLNNWLWTKTGLIIFILIPILLTVLLAFMNMIYGYLFETRKREHLKEMFGQYVPEKHIDAMLKAADSFDLSGEDREMTVLFADIRNFTTISEPMSASELKDMLNQFFTPMTEIIFNYKGTIDKYIGDLIMAFWGAPLADKKHAEHAISAALDMQIAVDKLKPIFAARGWAEVNIGIGLNSGIMSVGDMGSQFRRNYTVLGDAVNLGSRVEGLTKFYGVKIMVSEFTQKNQSKFIFRQLDRVRVKGKKVGIGIYEVVSRKKDASEALQQEVIRSDEALNQYFNQNFVEAERMFMELHTAHPDVKLYKLYMDRIAEFKTEPPPPEWNGVYVHATK
jgi:adenylate cyclase